MSKHPPRRILGGLLLGLICLAAAPAGAGAATDDYIVVLKDGVSEPAAAADHAKKGAEVFQHTATR